jgi:hypothetical protein
VVVEVIEDISEDGNEVVVEVSEEIMKLMVLGRKREPGLIRKCADVLREDGIWEGLRRGLKISLACFAN